MLRSRAEGGGTEAGIEDNQGARGQVLGMSEHHSGFLGGAVREVC